MDRPVIFPRGLAVQVLTAVLSDGTPLDLALDRIAKPHQLSSQSRAWLVDVCAGALRWRGRLELAVDSTALKKKPSGWLRKILLIAAYQLVVQERVAAALVVNETVGEVKKKEGEAPAKFANASLRKIADSAREWRELPFPSGSPVVEKAGWASFPEWLWSSLEHQQGEAWVSEFARATLERPTLWFRAAPDTQLIESATAGPVPGSYQSQEAGMVSGREGFAEGRFFVQDISSQILIHEISQDARSALGPGQLSVLDLCAAPGGKALGLAWNGFSVHATDIDAGRLSQLRENIERIRSDIRVLPREEVSSLEAQDLVWVDAPCSGSGIIRRHPDVRWLRKERDVQSLVEKQIKLVQEAWQKVRPGGFLAYSVCSVLKQEGPGVLNRCGLEAHVTRKWLLCPQQPPYGDGFWAALLRKPS